MTLSGHRLRHRRRELLAAGCVLVCAAFAGLGGCAGDRTASDGQMFINTNTAPLPALDGEPVSEGDARAIGDLTRQMSRAIYQRDSIGFLALCTDADPMTAAERRYFARDFIDTPVHFIATTAFEPRRRRVPGVDGVVVDAAVQWLWEYRDTVPGTTTPSKPVSRRHVDYARFIKTSDGWKYDGPIWDKTVKDGIEVWAMPRLHTAATNAADAFRDVRASVEATMNVHHKRNQVIKLFHTSDQLKFSIALSYNDDIDGWNEPNESIRLVSTPDQSRDDFRGLIAHEYGHVCTFALGPTANDMPWWTLEGVAEMCAEPFTRDGVNNLRELRSMADKGTLVPLKDLADFGKVTPQNFGHVYTHGHAIVTWIRRTKGSAVLDRWLRAMSNGTSYEKACIDLLGMTPAAIEQQWRLSLGASPVAAPNPKPSDVVY
ncbi:MAG: hypothetical protein SFY96_08850 [Planctomycetota bacterium]|nr:hypothetical protein [Planctomycetota bacterium]